MTNAELISGHVPDDLGRDSDRASGDGAGQLDKLLNNGSVPMVLPVPSIDGRRRSSSSLLESIHKGIRMSIAGSKGDSNNGHVFSSSVSSLSFQVGCDGEEDKIFFIWPTTIVHRIDRSSPLYNMSATDLLRERFEIVVILEGVIESTGMTTQARSSYLPSEILWGHRFQTLVTFKKLTGEYEVDYALFNNTVEVDTPLCSAKQLEEHRAMFNHEATSDHLDNMFAKIRNQSSDSLCSLDSSSIDDHIEIKIPPSPIPVTITAPDDDTTSYKNRTITNGSVPSLSKESITPDSSIYNNKDAIVVPIGF
ncbi:G protein-activated inward rectifier potassium channel 2-like [Agrilus planipennis]|uniref:G protein-activated inward rectifier potassium channel 2-like n=1 Tax=Agrilus planipennis TaxID=224129 RepID=A0A7F5RCW8_AGRPL|nr:G protein-activated inward rectifier potassium channel 2-like [Agrilus planipennis]